MLLGEDGKDGRKCCQANQVKKVMARNEIERPMCFMASDPSRSGDFELASKICQPPSGGIEQAPKSPLVRGGFAIQLI